MKRKSSSPFTLIELIVSMGIFIVIMLVLVQFMDVAQKLWLTCGKKTTTFEDARIAMDMITRDLQSVLYNEENSTKGIYPFWHEADDRINFISSTLVGANGDAPVDVYVPKIREIKWARTDSNAASGVRDLGIVKAYHPIASGTNLTTGVLVRAVTGDSSDWKYNFPYVPRNTTNPQRVYSIWKAYAGSGSSPYLPTNPDYSGTTETVPSTGGSGFIQVIPYVVSLKFTCYNKAGQNIRDKNGNGTPEESSADCDYVYNSTESASSSPLPYMVLVDLTLLDRTSWEKWLAMGGNVNAPDSDPAGARTFRQNNQRTFSKMIFIGERESL
jgi:hypothetical protein